MTAYLLVKAQDGWNSESLMTFNTGFPLHISDHNQIGGKQIPPKFCQFVISDADPIELGEYINPWIREIDWEFIGHDYAIDGHRLRVFMKPELVSASGLNGLTRDQVEGFLINWGASVVSIAANSVTFDATILNAATSEGFWGLSVAGITFTENAYNQTTGMHQIEANYKNSPLVNMSKDKIEAYIISKGGTIISHPTNKVTFEIERSVVFDIFKQDVYSKLLGTFAVRKFKIPEQYVQMALDNNGSLNVTRQQIATYIYNRLND